MPGYKTASDPLTLPGITHAPTEAERIDPYAQKVLALKTEIAAGEATLASLHEQIARKRQELKDAADAREVAQAATAIELSAREQQLGESRQAMARERQAMEERERERVRAMGIKLDSLDAQKREVDETYHRHLVLSHSAEQAYRQVNTLRADLTARLADLSQRIGETGQQIVANARTQQRLDTLLNKNQDDARSLQARATSLAEERAALDARLLQAQATIKTAAVTQQERDELTALTASARERLRGLDEVAAQQRDKELQLNVMEMALRVKDTHLSRREGIVKTAEEKLSA